MVNKILIKNCLALIEDHDTQKTIRTNIIINNDIIEYIGDYIKDDDFTNVIDGNSLFVVPGLINGHQHSHEHFQKGRIENLPLEMWMHYVRTLKKVKLTPRQIYLRTLIGAIEALKTGCTTIVDDVSISYPFDELEHESIYSAYNDSGLRAFIGFAMMDKPLIESFPFVNFLDKNNVIRMMDEKRPTPTEYINIMETYVDKWHKNKKRVGLIVSPSAPQRCTDNFLLQLRSFAEKNNLPLITHVQETRMQVVTGNKFYNKTIIEHMDELGFLGKNTSLIHAVWINAKEMEILCRNETSVQHNPWSNLLLGSGVQPVKELVNAGVNVTMGSDGSCSTHTINMLNNLGVAAGVSKIRDRKPKNWLSANEILNFATKNASTALGMGNKTGKIKIGYKADLCGYNINSITFTPLNDPVLQLIYAERGSALKITIIDGEIVLQDGNLVKLNEKEILKEVCDEFASIQKGINSCERDMDNIVEDFYNIYMKSEECRVDFKTFKSTINN